MEDFMTEIYPKELALTSDGATLRSHYLDLDIEINNDKFYTRLFDKRDAFHFQIVNFPDLSRNIPSRHSYSIFVLQLIRYARCCDELADFTDRPKALIAKLTKQNFTLSRLRRVFERFAVSHYELFSNIINYHRSFATFVVKQVAFVFMLVCHVMCLRFLNHHSFLLAKSFFKQGRQ
jgi:hypothetical protein